MITRFLLWLLGDLIVSSRDGSVSLTRLAAATMHFLSAVFFIWHNATAPFNELLWGIYMSIAGGHAYADKYLMVTKGKSNGPHAAD